MSKDKLLRRVNRILGQVAAVTRANEEEQDCCDAAFRITTARGALDSLMAEVLEGQIREHIEGTARGP